MKIFITGGNGMVGKNIHLLASKNGHEVIAPKRAELDLLDFKAVQNAIELAAPDVVIHCAGLVGGIQANIQAPFDFCNINLQLGINVVNAALSTGVKKLINLGSSCMYPRNAENPLAEEQILKGELEPTNEGYAIAKVAVASLCEYASKQHDVLYKTYIPCNLFGLWDKFDPKNSHMIPGVIRKIHEAKTKGSDTVDIWGDGLARREFMFASDLADFILYTLGNYSDVPQNINVGIGADYSVNEFYESIADVIQYKGEFIHDLSKPVGMKQKLVDISKQNKLGWAPKTSLKDGIKQTYEFFLQGK